MAGGSGLLVVSCEGKAQNAPEHEKTDHNEDHPSREMSYHFNKGRKGLICLCGALSGFKDEPGTDAQVARQRKYRCKALQSVDHVGQGSALRW